MGYGAAIAAVGALGASWLSNKGSSSANSANANLNADNRRWQEQMRASNYQATVDDLMKAGLNPMLAYSNGPSSTPGVSSIPMQNEYAGTADAINSGTSAFRASLEKKTAEANVNKINTEAAVNEAMLPKIQADAVGSVNSAAYTAANTKLVEVNVNKALAETQNIKDENSRIKAAIENLNAQTKNLPLTGEQIRMAIDLIGVQIKGGNIDTLKKSLDLPRLRNESEMHSGPGGSIMPYLPKTIQGPAAGAMSAWDSLTDYVREKRAKSGFDNGR